MLAFMPACFGNSGGPSNENPVGPGNGMLSVRDDINELSENSKINIPDINGEGQFTFYVINLNNKSMRVSSVYTPTTSGNVDNVIIGQSTVKRLFVNDGAFFVRQSVKYEVNFKLSGQTLQNPINFTQAGGTFNKGDYAVLTATSNGNVVGTFKYDFDKDINPQSISLGGASMDSISFVLTIYNADGDVLYLGNL